MPAEQKETTEAARSAARAEGEARPRSGLLLMREESRRWESGNLLLVFHFSIRRRRRSCWECGNLAAFWRDFQGARGKSGKPVFGFPRFPQAPHFQALFFAAEKQTVADPGQVPGKGGCASSTGARRSIVRLPSALLYVAES